jgi:HprK-related kinase A
VNLNVLSLTDIQTKLKSGGLILQIGPFSFRLFSNIRSVAKGVFTLYQDYPVLDGVDFVDYTIEIDNGRGIRRWIHPQARFKFDGEVAFAPLPVNQAFPLLEWAMNWCISTHAHQYLILHAAVIERGGCAVIMPAPPGSGKSTLCAGLVHRGWRLLSDELALISPIDRTITPLGRPISLKNQSIDVMRRYAPEAVFNRVTPDTAKGRLTHMRVPSAHLGRLQETAHPRWVVFPKYVEGSPPQLVPRSKANSMLELARNSFNYIVLGLKGFEALSKVIDTCDCYDFQYSQLDDAVQVFDNLVAQRNPQCEA